MSIENKGFIAELRAIVGRRHVVTSPRKTLRFRRGFRAPAGDAQAVVAPGSLVELWRVAHACVDAGVVIIVQAANTGLTGGSTPDGRIDRPVVIINTLRLNAIHPVNGGRQVICLPGATLHALERILRPYGREPHSVIGSTCFGASVIGGVCNNSGGALIRRGPAYTELALFARIDTEGTLRLVNRLGIDLGDDPEAALERIERGDIDLLPVAGAASDLDYGSYVRDVDAATPSRFNADPRRLFDASGSAGKLIVFAVRLDTFQQAAGVTTFYIGANDPAELTNLRRTMLGRGATLPVSAEYIHRDTFDVADRYGRDMLYAIRLLGTDRLPLLYAMKARLDTLAAMLGMSDVSDRLLQRLSQLLPCPLPRRMLLWRDRYTHHLILKVDRESLEATRAILSDLFPGGAGAYFECETAEAACASLHRFVAAGAASRMLATAPSGVGGLVALDVALPRNATEWFGELPDDIAGQVVAVLRYGHFFCHVFHRDYLVAPGADQAAIKARLLRQLDLEKAEYPAEHNVGRQYLAKPVLSDFYRRLDPTNRLNPGIGRTSVSAGWAGMHEGDMI